MTVYYPDISAYQKGIAIDGPAVCCKATEGTGWLSSDYAPALARAARAGTFAFGYHFLHHEAAAAQAGFCHRVVGGQVGLMLDFEPAGSSRPDMGDAVTFLDAYAGVGGVCHLTYLPHWYWEQLGRPSLAPLAKRGQALVSSNYTPYHDDGPGWAPYGGLTPVVWQFTASRSWHGQPVDFNAYRGTLDQLKALVMGGARPPVPPHPPAGPAFPYGAGHYLGQPSPSPYCHSGYWGGPDQAHVHDWQARMAGRGWTLVQDGRFGQQSDHVARAFQAEKGLGVDGKVGADTWTATWASPVTRSP